MGRRISLLLALVCFVALMAPAPAGAQAWPNRPVRLVVPFPAGGPADALGRVIADQLNKIWGQPVVIENRGGAGGNLGAEVVARAAPDGYTLLLNASSHVINASLYERLPYDPIKDFTPISSVCVNPLVLVVHPSMPDTVQGLVELMKKNPGKYSYATSGTGSILHLTSEYFKREVGDIDVVHVPYRGSGPAIPDLLAGNVAWMFETFSTMMQHHKAGKLRILAFAHQKRAAIAPDIPTMIEAGVPGFEAYTFNLFLGPAGTPKNVVDTVDQATRKVMADPSTIKFLEDIAAVPTPDTTPQRTAKFIQDELNKWAPVIKAAGIRLE
jgi:tripartite-type tricarboxylate transporter receptor subunit TctC